MFKNKKLVIVTCGILVIGLGLYGLRFVDSSGEKASKNCLFGQVVKCGYIDKTEDEILQEINYLHLSKRQAKKLFLEAQGENQKYLDLYSEKEKSGNISEENMQMKIIHQQSVPYFERALRVVNHMDN